MTIFVDADACPVVDDTIRLSVRYSVPCILVCDDAHQMQRPPAVTITVGQGADSADYALVNRVKCGDIVVTQDYGLAAMCLAKKAIPIHQNGFLYTEDNIDRLLDTRYQAKKVMAAGGRVKGPKKRKPQDTAAFCACLEQILKEKTR